MRLRLGTRASALALTQTKAVAAALERAADGPLEVELVRVSTRGDEDKTRPFAEIGAAGVFVRALETALAEGEVDVAVHSYKDLPSASPPDLAIVATPPRADPRDRLLVAPDAHAPDAPGLLPLARGARVGTASARRAALLRDLRPDLEPVLLRGNVNTRLARLVEGRYDAILLAAAGLDRLAAAGALEVPGELHALDLDPERFVPAPTQGALAVQVRADDAATRAAAERVDDAATRHAAAAERRLLELVQAGCDAPFGAFARPVDGAAGPGATLRFDAALERDGRLLRARAEGADPAALADEAYAALFDGGAP